MGALVLLGGTASAYTEGLKTAMGDAHNPKRRHGMAGLIEQLQFYARLGRPY